ncbi:hypothetical protein BPODLACK_03288 [Gordonia sp. YY1]|nr:hypothetical protein BPODLACK_03288 [Gordonia sp. YY1]
MPLSGMRFWRSLRSFSIVARSRADDVPGSGMSTLTGTKEVNQPTVSLRSAPGATDSSRPWFSRSIDTSEAP